MCHTLIPSIDDFFRNISNDWLKIYLNFKRIQISNFSFMFFYFIFWRFYKYDFRWFPVNRKKYNEFLIYDLCKLLLFNAGQKNKEKKTTQVSHFLRLNQFLNTPSKLDIEWIELYTGFFVINTFLLMVFTSFWNVNVRARNRDAITSAASDGEKQKSTHVLTAEEEEHGELRGNRS